MEPSSSVYRFFSTVEIFHLFQFISYLETGHQNVDGKKGNWNTRNFFIVVNGYPSIMKDSLTNDWKKEFFVLPTWIILSCFSSNILFSFLCCWWVFALFSDRCPQAQIPLSLQMLSVRLCCKSSLSKEWINVLNFG